MRAALIILALLAFALLWCGGGPESPPEDDIPTDPIEDE